MTTVVFPKHCAQRAIDAMFNFQKKQHFMPFSSQLYSILNPSPVVSNRDPGLCEVWTRTVMSSEGDMGSLYVHLIKMFAGHVMSQNISHPCYTIPLSRNRSLLHTKKIGACSQWDESPLTLAEIGPLSFGKAIFSLGLWLRRGNAFFCCQGNEEGVRPF